MSSLTADPDEAALKQWFADRGLTIEWREHPPTARVADAERIKGALPPGHSKSLLLAAKDGALTLLAVRGLVRADLKGLAKAVGSTRFSFAPAELMAARLGVTPGNLSPLALMRDRERGIARVVIDEGLLGEALVWCHPLRNTASVGMCPADLLAFVEAHHGPAVCLDAAAPKP